MQQNKTVLKCQQLRKVYTEGPQQLEILKSIDLEIFAGERIAIIGASGAGKTTLLNMLGGLDLPTSGEVVVADQPMHKLDEKSRGRIRNQFLGFVYQFHHLLPEFTALENVAMPLLIRGCSPTEAAEKSRYTLNEVGLAKRESHKPAELSGGERQRVAIARALVTEPACVLLDEPTGNLDQHTARKIQQLMLDLSVQSHTAFIIVTHDTRLAEQMDRVLELDSGVLTERGRA